MGWMMLFWVAVIVGVPTVIWFLLSEGVPGDGGIDQEDAEHRAEQSRR